MSRTDNSVRNIKFSVIKFLLQNLFKFILRTVVIYVLGKQYLGLNGLFTNVLGVLSLTELGIGQAIVFSLYKPIAQNDVEKVKTLNALYKKVYYILAIVVLTLGLITCPFLEHLVSGEPPKDVNLYLIYIIYLLNTVISYLGAHKRSLLFAHQKNYIEDKIMIFALTCMYVLQILLLFVFKNYYYYIVLIPVFTALETILVVRRTNKLYPQYLGKAKELDKTTKKEVAQNVGAMSMIKIADVFVNSTDNIIMSAFLGLSVVGIFSNYALIISTITSVITLIISAIRGSVGNLVATSEKEYVYKRYKMFNVGFAWVIGFCAVCLLLLFQNFIELWTSDKSYLISTLEVVFLVFNFYIGSMRMFTRVVKNVAGFIKNDSWKGIVQGISNIIFSIVLLKYWGLLGIIIGTTISHLIVPIWIEPYILYKKYFNKSVFRYWARFAYYFATTLVAALVTGLLCYIVPGSSVGWFALKVVICGIVPNIIFVLMFSFLQEFKDLISFVKNILFKKLKKKKLATENSSVETLNVETDKNLDNKESKELNKNESERED